MRLAHKTIEFSANYRRYTPEMSDALVRIATAIGAIRGAQILPATADQLRASARIGTVHYSNLIEGNELPVIEAERAARGKLGLDSRAKIELVNYVDALDLIDARIDSGTLELTPAFLKELHGTATRGLGRADDPHFKPHHEGEWRDGTAIVVDHASGQVMHEGPPQDEVSPRMNGMFEWLRNKLETTDSAFELAGVMHYGITEVHPFADGNGRAARLFQTAVLMNADVLPGRMFSFERYYATDRSAYYSALRSVREKTYNMENWLHYFLRGLVEEYERVATTVADLSSMTPAGASGQLRLSAGQERALTALRIQGRQEFNRREYEQAANVGRSTAGADLQELINHDVLVARGRGPSARYVFSAATRSPQRSLGRGRPERWTDSAVEQELRAFLLGRTTWPSPHEFRAAGQGALYTAASRRGGIARWRRIMGM